MEITLGQHYNVGEKSTVILYTYLNHHAEPQIITKHKHHRLVDSEEDSTNNVDNISTIEPYKNRGLGKQ